MSDRIREKPTVLTNNLNERLFTDAYDFCKNTIDNSQARMRQVNVVICGAIGGGVKDIPNEFKNHTLDTTKKIAVNMATGAGIAALLSTGSPWIVGSTLVGSGFLLGAGLRSSWDKARNNKELSKALSASWKSNDPLTTYHSIKIAEKQLGPEVFDYVSMAV